MNITEKTNQQYIEKNASLYKEAMRKAMEGYKYRVGLPHAEEIDSDMKPFAMYATGNKVYGGYSIKGHAQKDIESGLTTLYTNDVLGGKSTMRGQGAGSKHYGHLARQAYEKGYDIMANDSRGSTSEAAQKVWNGMIKKGYPINKIGEGINEAGHLTPVRYALDLKKMFGPRI